MMRIDANPLQRQVWDVRFDPSEGDEIRKIRPAVIISDPNAGKMRLRIVVPITGWQSHFDSFFWMVKLQPSTQNWLGKLSSADCFQVKSFAFKYN